MAMCTINTHQKKRKKIKKKSNEKYGLPIYQFCH